MTTVCECTLSRGWLSDHPRASCSRSSRPHTGAPLRTSLECTTAVLYKCLPHHSVTASFITPSLSFNDATTSPGQDMSEYPEFNYSPNSRGDIRIDTSFSPTHSFGRDFHGETSRDRYSRQGSQTQPRGVRDVTWISTPSQVASTHAHTPQTPRYIQPTFQQVRTPTPVLPRSAPTLSDSEVDYFNVTVEEGRDNCEHEGRGYGFSEVAPAYPNVKNEKRNLVGGFVSGLRRLPKVMSRSRLKEHGKIGRQGPPSAASTADTGRATLGQYRPPLEPIPKADSDGIPDVERLESPARAMSDSPQRLIHSGDENSCDQDRSHSSGVFSSSEPRTHSDINTSISSQGFGHNISDPIAISTPILAEPRPSADFAKMEPPPRPPPEESVASQLARMRRFFRDLNGLPWIAPRGISDVYVPGQPPSRRRYSRQRQPKHPASWYTPRNNRPLDLLAGPSTTGLLPPHQSPQQIPPQTPQFVLGSGTNLLFTHHPAGVGGGDSGGGGSRSPTHEGPLSTDSHGSQSPPVLGPAYVATPLFVYPSGLPPQSTGGSNGNADSTQMPRPVYLVASSIPQYMDQGQASRTYAPQHPSGLRTAVM